jgi:DNA repair photolyase
MENFKGKAIYNPSGKAGEYSYWACNFYVGCSNDCSYCYCKKGVLGSVMGANVATLKKCFKSNEHALQVFEKELLKNIDSLREHGLFFTFTSDPMLKETIGLTIQAMVICNGYDIPVKILTKKADWIDAFLEYGFGNQILIAIGFTLTGHDELEPGASPNAERIEAMRKLHKAGFKTFASIEPIIDFNSSIRMIKETAGACDLYKIGLLAGGKYNQTEAMTFYYSLIPLLSDTDCRVYFKDSFINLIGIDRQMLASTWSKAAGRDYNMFLV